MYGFEMKQKATQNAVDSAPKMPEIKVGFADIWRFVWSYFWRYPFLVLGSYAALTVSVLAEVVQPLILEALVDSITAGGIPTEERFHAAIFFVCLMVGQGMLFHCSYRIAHFIGNGSQFFCSFVCFHANAKPAHALHHARLRIGSLSLPEWAIFFG